MERRVGHKKITNKKDAKERLKRRYNPMVMIKVVLCQSRIVRDVAPLNIQGPPIEAR